MKSSISTRPRAWKPLLTVAAAAVLGLSGVIAIQGCGTDIQASQEEESYLHVAETQPVRMQSGYVLEREFAGEVRAGQTSDLGFELAGQITELLVDEGQDIRHGQLLARLDSRIVLAQGDELDAQLAELDAELQTVRRNLERAERLRGDNLISERERDNLAGRVDVLNASLDRVRAAREVNEIRLGKLELRAPFDSRIDRRHVDSGVVVEAGSPIFSLVESGAREVRAGVPVSMAERLHPGKAVEVRVGRKVSVGHVIHLGPVVNQATQSRFVRIAVEDPWSPGEIAYLLIGVNIEMAGAWVPAAAVTEGVRGTWVVYAAMPEGDSRARLESRSVVIHHAAGGRLYVSGSLSDGETIVSGGLHRLAPGQRIRPQPAALENLSLATEAR